MKRGLILALAATTSVLAAPVGRHPRTTGRAALAAPAPRARGPSSTAQAGAAGAGLSHAGGRHWRLRTAHGPVHVWTPPGYRHDTAGVVVYVHGYYTRVDRAWREHGLAEQFAASGRNALFIVPEAPARAAHQVRWRDLGDLARQVGARIRQPRPWGPVVAIGHSGAYRTLRAWLDDPLLEHVILVDALYANEEPFITWLDRPRGHAPRRLTLVSLDTLRWSELLVTRVPGARVLDWVPDDPADVPAGVREARFLHIRSQHGHMALVTEGTTIPVLLRMTRLPSVP